MPTKYTPFSLFIRQALLYPLTSPFLPAEADVKFGVSYANGKLTGQFYQTPPPENWQNDQNVTFNYADAVDYAAHLEVDGVTVNPEVQNIWRLPTISELIFAICLSVLPDGDGRTDVFNNSSEYIGSPLRDEFDMYTAKANGGFPQVNSQDSTGTYSVICVKI